MKNISLLLSLLVCCKLVFPQSPGKVSVTFNLDITAESKNVRSFSSIGIRGSIPPLSWDKTYFLKDDDKDGIYTATVNFETGEPMFNLRFKYFHDTASWEKGNDRVILTRERELNLPVDKWNVVPLVNSPAYTDSVSLAWLHKEISTLDSLLFDTYNNCRIEQHAAFFSEDIEFYHDKGGLSTSKKDLIEAVKKNICGKVNRELLKGSIEVSPIPGYGAVELGEHRFHNLIEKSTSGYSKFVIVWQFKNGKWLVTRVISLHK